MKILERVRAFGRFKLGFPEPDSYAPVAQLADLTIWTALSHCQATARFGVANHSSRPLNLPAPVGVGAVFWTPPIDDTHARGRAKASARGSVTGKRLKVAWVFMKSADPLLVGTEVGTLVTSDPAYNISQLPIQPA